ncbi:MAG: hypothetical protein HQ517_07445 [SAR324 cluster bacterium]|nr:hypothetical protein [SAR324 cluster bacterium]
MKSGFELFVEDVCNNKISEAYLGQVSNRDNENPQWCFDRIFSQRIATYSLTVSEKDDPPGILLKRLIDSNPSFLFRLVLDWSQVPGTKTSTRKLLLGIVVSLILKDPESNAHINNFITAIDPLVNIKTLNSLLIQKTAGEVFVPQRVFKDFMALTKDPISIRFTQNLEEHIENMFYFEATSQFFLTYYFDLLCHAKTETISGFVHIIFLKLFSALKHQMVQYWDQYQEESWQQQGLHELVNADLPGKCHPLLGKTAFKSIELYNPLLSRLADINSEEIKKRFSQKLQGFLSLSTITTTLLLDTVLMLKGHENVLSLLTLLRASRPQKLDQLLDFMSAKSGKTNRELYQLVKRFIEKEPVSEIEKSSQEITSESEATENFLLQEIIPIGFEKGAPKIAVSTFFEFPFGKTGSGDADPFSQHLRYLEDAVSHAALTGDELTKIRVLLSTLPTLAYRKTYDIYPSNQFDEAILLIVFSLWQNQVLKNLLV